MSGKSSSHPASVERPTSLGFGRRTARGGLALAAALGGALPAHAQSAVAATTAATAPATLSDPLLQPAWARKNSGLSTNLSVDVPVTIGATAVWLSLELLRQPLAPTSCRWCDLNDDGSDGLNAFDRTIRQGLRWDDVETANVLSTAFSFVLAPAAGVGIGALIAAHDARLAELPEDLLVVTQAAMLASSLNGVVKLLAARQRPDIHAKVVNGEPYEPSSADNLSFFSGHATLAFALATSAGTVASMRHHRWAPLMWISGMAFASTGAYMRIAADRHYATDVLTGILVGGAVGFAVPYVFHQPKHNLELMLAPSPGGVQVFGMF
jgi:membrane-associated phospholipid phosphatase